MGKTIAVNTRLLLPGRLDGIGWFTYHTLREITLKHPEDEFIFIFDRPWAPEFIFTDNVRPVMAPPQARHPILFWYWFEKVIPAVLRKSNADLFLSPDGFLPLRSPVPMLPVIHDINFLHYPQYLPWMVRKYYNYFFPKMAAAATRIATVSEYSKQDISSHYQIAPDKIDVVFNGAGEQFHPLSQPETEAFRKKITGGAPFFLIVGTIHPRKNIDNQLKAFAAFKREDHEGYKLVIAGSDYYRAGETRKLAAGLGLPDDVIFLGRVDTPVLNELYNAASALLFVSWFEGFGIPIVEAFRCHLPVITSSVSSLPEVAGNAALYADPASPDSICRAMMVLAKDVEKRGELVKKIMDRKDTFTWQKSADLLWESMQKTIHAQKILP